MVFEVKPRVGIGPVQIGMTIDEVSRVLNANPRKCGSRLYLYLKFIRCEFSEDNKLNYVEAFEPHMEGFSVCYKGKDVFKEKFESLVSFLENDSEYVQDDDDPDRIIHFKDLGISLWRDGVPDEDDPDLDPDEGLHLDVIAVRNFWDGR